MQIVQVIKDFSLRGGLGCVAYELQRSWNQMGLKSQVVTGTAPDSEERTDITLLDFPFRNVEKSGGKLAKYVGRIAAVTSFTLTVTGFLKRTHKGPIILSHGDSLLGDVVVIHAVNKASLIAKREAGEYGWLLNPMHLWVGARDRYMIRGLRYKRYVAISERVSEELQKLYGVPKSRISIIPNGVNVQRFTPHGSGRIEVRSELGIAPDARVLLFVGHEFKRKGLWFVIAALALLPDDFHLIVVGNDNPAPYQAMISKIGANRRVIFTGPRKDIPELNRAADALVFPTYYEAFPLVGMEACASGLPIIATRVGGIEEYLKDGINGYFIERSGASIAKAITLAFSSPEHLQTLGRNGRQTALDYTWDKIAIQYYDLFKSIKESGQLEPAPREAAEGSGIPSCRTP